VSRKQIGCVRIRPFGRRIEKSSSAGTSIYAYDGDNLVEETNSSGAVVARYSQGLNIDEPLAMLRSGATDFYEVDGLGSVTSLTSTAGALAQTYAFGSFGKQTASSGSLTNPFQYTGREFDPETSLYYYRARYYDPMVGRFVLEDPIRFTTGKWVTKMGKWGARRSASRAPPVQPAPPAKSLGNSSARQLLCWSALAPFIPLRSPVRMIP